MATDRVRIEVTADDDLRGITARFRIVSLDDPEGGDVMCEARCFFDVRDQLVFEAGPADGSGEAWLLTSVPPVGKKEL